MKTKYWGLVVSMLLILQMMGLAQPVKAGSVYTWGEVQQGTYSDFYPYTFLWSGNPFDGHSLRGMNLTTMEMTSDVSEIDIVINQYGAMAANGVVELDEGLTDATDEDGLPNFGSTVQLAEKQVYLIVTSDDDLVKLRIDRVLPTRVTFSYTFISDIVDDSEPQGNYEEEAQDVYYDMNEGEVTVSVTAEDGDAYYQLYRSDNGGEFVKLTDFPIYEPFFEDQYAFAGHTYVYYFEIYDHSDNLIANSVYITVDVKEPKKLTPTPAPTPTPKPTPTSLIKLQVNNKKASVNGVEHILDVPPTIVNGRTLVPIRFISEALGAQVQWNAKDRSVTINQNGTIIVLWLDKSAAKVNGKQVMMDVPAQVRQGRTMVPIRFVSENLNQEITFDQKTYIIEIRSKGGSTSSTQTNPSANDITSSSLSGSWDLFVPGGFNTYSVGGGMQTTQYTPGAGGDVLTINSNGTYSWKDVGGKVIKGTWVKDGSGLLLQQAEYGWDWSVFETDEGIKVSTYGTYYVGTRR